MPPWSLAATSVFVCQHLAWWHVLLIYLLRTSSSQAAHLEHPAQGSLSPLPLFCICFAVICYGVYVTSGYCKLLYKYPVDIKLPQLCNVPCVPFIFLYWNKSSFISCWRWCMLTIWISEEIVFSLVNLFMPIYFSLFLTCLPTSSSPSLAYIVFCFMFAVWWLCFVVLVYCKVVSATVELYFVYIDKSSFCL